MYYKKVYLLAFILVFGDIFFACCRCGNMDPIPYSHCILDSDNMELVDDRYIPTTSGEIDHESYALSIAIRLNEYVCDLKAKPLFASTAMACSCDDPFGKAINQISELNIYTVHNYDSLSPAGTIVNEYFSIHKYGVSNLPVSEAPQYLNTESEYYNYKGITLSLNSPPDNDDPQSFLVEILLTDGRIISDTTSTVRFF